MTRTRRRLLTLAALAMAAGCSAGGTNSPAPARPPNVILVFIDDLGYADLGVTGNHRARTPNIDRLAAQGTRFTDFYVNAPICSPSRVAITTGTYPSRWRIDSFLAARQQNRNRGLAHWLDPAAPTLPRALQRAGYATAHFGKWHMGGGRDVGDAPLPAAYGFDESVTSFEGLGDRYLWRGGENTLNEQSAALGRGDIRWTEKSEMTRHYVDHAIDFLRRHRDRPVYINVWPNDVHDPFDPRAADLARYASEEGSDYDRRLLAVLEEMDLQLGRLFDEVDRLGLAEETLILLTGDNGPTDWPRYYREGVTPPGATGPFRGRKWSLYEGGIREPLIARWPGRTPVGVVDSTTLLAAIDLVPSIARLAGADLSGERIDGEDLSPALRGGVAARQAPIFWFYPNDLRPGEPSFVTPRLAVRDGRWKLLVEEDGTGAQLYDLRSDPGETRDRASAEPAVVQRLKDRVLAWRREMVRSAAATPAAPISR